MSDPARAPSPATRVQAAGSCTPALSREQATGHEAQVQAAHSGKKPYSVLTCGPTYASPHAQAAGSCTPAPWREQATGHQAQVQAAHCVGTSAMAVADGIALVSNARCARAHARAPRQLLSLLPLARCFLMKEICGGVFTRACSGGQDDGQHPLLKRRPTFPTPTPPHPTAGPALWRLRPSPGQRVRAAG